MDQLDRIEKKVDEVKYGLNIVIEILQYGQLRRAADKLKQKTRALKAALEQRERK